MDYKYWCGLSDEELARQDIPAMNLACAEGLPGSENLDAKKSLARLEQWTERARDGRSRALRNRPRLAKEFAHLSDAEYLIVSLYAILYRHIKLEPNLDCQDETKPYDASDSRDKFIHAVLTDLPSAHVLHRASHLRRDRAAAGLPDQAGQHDYARLAFFFGAP